VIKRGAMDREQNESFDSLGFRRLNQGTIAVQIDGRWV
jgi:hypothetical protein